MNASMSSPGRSLIFVLLFVASAWPSPGRTGSPTPFTTPKAEVVLFRDATLVDRTTGNKITYSSVVFSLYNNYDGTGNWEIRSSVDAYATALSSGTFSGIFYAGELITADVSALGVQNGTVQFRIYTFNNSGERRSSARSRRYPYNGEIRDTATLCFTDGHSEVLRRSGHARQQSRPERQRCYVRLHQPDCRHAPDHRDILRRCYLRWQHDQHQRHRQRRAARHAGNAGARARPVRHDSAGRLLDGGGLAQSLPCERKEP